MQIKTILQTALIPGIQENINNPLNDLEDLDSLDLEDIDEEIEDPEGIAIPWEEKFGEESDE